MFDKKNGRRGVTLVELIVALAIMSIVLLWVGHFVITGSSLSGKQSATADVHNEVQVASNFISDAIMSSQLGLSYQVGEVFALNGAGQNDADKILYVFNLDETSNEKRVIVTLIKWDCDEKIIYVAKGYAEDSDNLSATESIEVQEADYEVLADHIESFNVDLGSYASKNSAVVHVSAKKMKAEYENDATVHIRNSVIINAQTIREIYARISTAIESAVLGVTVDAPSKSVPGGNVQLSTSVRGVGFPSQDIFMWRVVGVKDDNSEVEIYNSRDTDSVFNTTVEKETKVLKISETIDTDTENCYKIRVYAYVNTGCQTEAQFIDKLEKAGETGGERSGCIEYPVTGSSTVALAYGYSEINILKITNLILKVGDLQASWRNTQGETETLDLLGINTGDRVEMSAQITGYNLTDEDKEVFWSIERQDNGIGLSLSQNGVLSIGRFSGGGYCTIKVQSTLDSSINVLCKININNPYAEGNHVLEITGADRMYRGAAKQLGLRLDDTLIPTSEIADFDWTIESVSTLEGSTVANGATISNGRVVISDSLSYDYTYYVTVKASLKSNSSVSGTATIEIPRVSIQVTPTAFCKPGSKLDYGEINASVIGIEQNAYELEWDIAKQGNESQYLKTYTNGTYILSRSSGSQHTCQLTVSIQDNSLNYLRVRVRIKNHATYYATCLVTLRTVTVTLTAPSSTTVTRGSQSGNITLTVKDNNQDADTSSAVWTIVSARCNGTDLTDAEKSKLSLTGTGNKRTLKVDSGFVQKTGNVDVVVQAEIYGIAKTVTLTVSGVTFDISLSNTSINRGGSITLPSTASKGGRTTENITWSIVSVSAGDVSDVHLGGTGSRTLSLDKDFDPENRDNTIILVKAKGNTSGLEKTVSISVNKVTVGDISGSYKAGSVSGFNSSSDYTIKWSHDGGSVVTLSSTTGASITVSVTDDVSFNLTAAVYVGSTKIVGTDRTVNVTIAKPLGKPTDINNWGTRQSTKVNYDRLILSDASANVYGWKYADSKGTYYLKVSDNSNGSNPSYYYYKSGSWYEWDEGGWLSSGSWSSSPVSSTKKYVYSGNLISYDCNETVISVLNALKQKLG